MSENIVKQHHFRRRNRLVLAAALTIGVLASAAFAEDIWIKAETVQIRSGKGAVYPVIATATKGTQLTVLDHEGSWLKVKVGDQEGYVFENAVSPTKVEGGGNLLASMGTGPDASALSTGAAAKGLSGDADNYASSQHMSPAPLDALIAFRKTIQPKDWEAFVEQGKVGPDAPGH